MTLFQLLDYLKIRPNMYLKAKSLAELEAFMGGYTLALYLNGIETKTDNVFQDFYDYIYSTYEIEKFHTWYEAVNLLAKLDDSDPFDKFFEIFDQFKTSTNSKFINVEEELQPPSMHASGIKQNFGSPSPSPPPITGRNRQI